MNELATYEQSGLPGTIEDLSRFVLVGREKLTAVRAAIRAIDRVQLAQEVRNQKMDEARMLSEALLDAEVRLGEMTKQMQRWRVAGSFWPTPPSLAQWTGCALHRTAPSTAPTAPCRSMGCSPRRPGQPGSRPTRS